MKALSIRQPYAFTVVRGYKPVENRDWWCGHRGPLLIHAGRLPLLEDVDDVVARIADQAGVPVEAARQTYEAHAPVGGLVGAVMMTDCADRHASPWFTGRYGFVFRDACPCAFTPWRGERGLFDVPDRVVAGLGLPDDWPGLPAKGTAP